MSLDPSQLNYESDKSYQPIDTGRIMFCQIILRAKAPLQMGPVRPSHQEKVWELGNLVPSKKMELAEKKLT